MLAHRTEPLTREQLARALGWTLTKLDDACESAHQRLDATGLQLIVTGTGRCRLEPRHGLLSEEQLRRLSATTDLATTHPRAYKLLLRLRRSPLENVQQTLSHASDRRAFQALVAHQIIDPDKTPLPR